MPKLFPVGNLHFQNKSYRGTDYTFESQAHFLIEDDELYGKKR